MRFGAITHARSPILRAAVIQVMPFPAVEIRIAKGNKGQGLPFMAALVQYPLSFIAAVLYCNGAPYVPLQSMGIMGSHCSLWGPIAVYMQRMLLHCCTRVPLPCDPGTSQSESIVSASAVGAAPHVPFSFLRSCQRQNRPGYSSGYRSAGLQL
jgi:hypothetical protein